MKMSNTKEDQYAFHDANRVCVCVLGLLWEPTGAATTASTKTVHLEDWGDHLTYWDKICASRHANIHIEDLQFKHQFDAEDIPDIDSLQYLHFSKISWAWFLDGPMDDMRRHEDAFLHHSDPACLVLFQAGLSGDIELRWRLDYRSFADGDTVTVGSEESEVRQYRVSRGTSPGLYNQMFTTAVLTGDEGTFSDTTALNGQIYYYLIESIVDGSPIPYSTEQSITKGEAGNTEPVFWLKSRSFIEDGYIEGSGSAMTFNEPVRFGSANANTSATVRLLIKRDEALIDAWQGGSADDESAKALVPEDHYNTNGFWSGSDLIFPSFSTGLVDAANNPVADIAAGEIQYAGCFPFRLEYDYSSAPAHFPRAVDGWSDPFFSAALNNRSVSSRWFYYSVVPGHPAWKQAVSTECFHIVNDDLVDPDDWQLSRPAFQGVFADVVEWTFPGWTDVLLPRDYDAATYGPGMLNLCNDVRSGLGTNTLLINGLHPNFIQEDDVDRVYIDGMVKVQRDVLRREDFYWKLDGVRDAVVLASSLGKPIHVRSHAGMVKESTDPDQNEVPYIDIYRNFELIAYWLVMEHGPNDLTKTSLGYAGGDYYEGRTMAFPESQIDLGVPDAGTLSIAQTAPWCAARSFDYGNALVVYNTGYWGDSNTPPDPSYTAREILSYRGLSTSATEWYRLQINDDLTTTEGGRIEFVPVDLDTDLIGPAHGFVLMQDPPFIPRILGDAQSPVWLSGGESELEIKVLHSETSAIEICEASIHALEGDTLPSAASTYELLDDGLGADDVAGDDVFTLDLTSQIGTLSVGEYEVWVYAQDDDGYYQYGRTTVQVVADDLAAKYQDYSAESEINYTGTPYSSLAFDINEDGFEDVLVTIQDQRSSCQVKTGINPDYGNPLYSDRTSTDFVGTDFADATDCRGLALGDYDNDGDEDLFVAHATTPILLENNGPQPSGQFTDASVIGLTSEYTADSWAGAWGDFNADGRLDLYISRAGAHDPQGRDFLDTGPISDRLMMNQNDTLFVASDWFIGMLTDAQPSFTASWCDVERDGDMDLFVPASNAEGTSAGARFYERTDSSQFQDGLASWFPGAEIANTTSAAWTDLDNDGDLDLVLSQIAGLKPADPARPYLFLKDDAASSFTWNTTALPEIDLPTWDVRPLDFDLDGWTDLLFVPAKLDSTEPARAPRLFRNSGSTPLAFEDVSDASGIGALTSVVNGVALADYDLDGDLDLFLGRPTAGDAGFYYLSEPTGTPNRWLGVKLVGSADILANRSCIGTQVLVTSLDGGTILSGIQSYGGGRGRGGDGSRSLRFGLGGASGPVVVETYWLSGYVQRDTVAVDQIVTIHDDTPPSFDPGTFRVQCNVAPGQLVWVFDWIADYELANSVDQVILNGPSTNWADLTVTPANASHVVTGQYHGLIGFMTDCAKGLHTITMTMSSNGQSQSVNTTYRTKICISGF